VEALGINSTFLGLDINTDALIVKTSERRMKRLRDILKRHWNKHQKNFTARHAAQLIGNFVSCLQGCHWLKLLSFEFTRLSRTALSHNSHRLIHTKHFDALISEPSTSWLEPTAGDKDAKLAGLKSEYAKALWRCQEKTWMPQAAHDQATYLVNLINHHLKGCYRWFRPISHIVRHKEDQLQYQDASSAYGIGGHVPSYQVYWTLAWTDFGPAVAKWIKTTLNQGGNEDVHINWLEYLTNFFGLALAAILEK
jgi:hypothetical protein